MILMVLNNIINLCNVIRAQWHRIENYNRIKVVLAEKKRSNKWLQNNLVKIYLYLLCRNGVPILRSLGEMFFQITKCLEVEVKIKDLICEWHKSWRQDEFIQIYCQHDFGELGFFGQTYAERWQSIASRCPCSHQSQCNNQNMTVTGQTMTAICFKISPKVLWVKAIVS